MFYESTYSGVTWWQLFGGWILFFGWLAIRMLIWGFKGSPRKYPESEEREIPQPERPISGREYADIISPYTFEIGKAVSLWEDEKKRHERDLGDLLNAGLENNRLNERVISLEAQITRYTVRPRGKNGRFLRGGK